MTDKSDSGEESYSYTSSKIFYKRSRSKQRDVASTKVYVSTVDDADDVDDASEYRPVSKWAVDYNNRNYIRSMCNKNKGLHRELKGRPPKFKIHYDNNYFTRSKVNAPKGLYRKIPEIKRKYVPDNDDLADATGWEFDYGPEFDQEEQDVNYIPEGRIIRRGCYRWYGVKRNDSDCDIKVEEERENLLNEELEQELKYGQEFLQSDIPYLEEERNKRYTRGGYRFYEVPRNIHDFKPEELAEIPRDPEWKRKYHCNGVRYLDLEMGQSDTDDDTSEHRQQTKKGKPFRRTILNKVYELKKDDSSKDVKRHGTRLSLIMFQQDESKQQHTSEMNDLNDSFLTHVELKNNKYPGEGRQSLYEGIPDRQRYGTEKTDSVRSVYKKKTEKFRSSREGGEYEEYQTEDTEKSYTEVRPAFEERQKRKAEVRSGRRIPDEGLTRKEKGGRRFDDYTHKVKPEEKFKPRRQDRNGNTTDDRERFKSFKEDKFKPRRQSRNGNTTDDRESFESFKESNLYEKEADKRGHRIVEKKSSETFYEKRGFPLKDAAVDRRRNKGKYYDHQELPSQKGLSRSQDRRHGNEIYKQTEGSEIKSKTRDRNKINVQLQHIRDRGKIPKDVDNFKTELTPGKQKTLKKMPPHVDERVKNGRGGMERKTELVDRKGTKIKGKTRDRNNINIHLQHIRDRGKTPRDADNFQAKLTLGTEKVSKKMPPHVDERVKNVLGKIERKIELGDRKDKGEVKKMPPHVEERIKNIREKLERKMEPADRKQTGLGGRNIYDFSSSDEGIDLMKHKDHPNDRGETHNSGYEKYITENGSEIWVKKNEKYAELHHKSHT